LTSYKTDFQARHHDFELALVGAGRSAVQRQAATRLRSISNVLVKIENSTSTTMTLGYLDISARRLMAVSNLVRRAILMPINPSSMTAKIGRLSFNATQRSTIGFLTNGVLNLAGFSVADFGRGIQLYVTGVTTNTPATYPLVGNNSATYTAVAPSSRVFIFQSIPGPEENPSSLTIDAITQRFVIGRFNFTGVIQGPISDSDTNTTATVTNGEFQLNFY
jgi:hypothetical protein